MILLIRHGEADHHVKELTGGWTDSALTVRGQQQFQQLADCLAGDFSGRSLPRIVSSDLQRARTGAEIIAQKLGTDPVECFSFLREKNNGKAAGLNKKEALAFYHPPVTGRELEEPDRDLIIVSHKGTIQNILFAWLGLSIEEVAEKRISFDIRPASVTVLGMNKWGEHAVFVLNDTSYQWKQGPMGIFNFPFGA